MSTVSQAFAAFLLSCTLAGTAYAAPACADPAPGNPESLAKWKRELIDQFDQAAYLDENGATISEEAFLQALREKRRPFEMTQTTVDGRKTRIVLKLMPQGDKGGCA